MLPPSPGEDPTTAAGATSPPLAWQDVDLQRRCGGDASVNADAVNDDDYNDGGGNSDSNNNDGGRDLALVLVQLHPHPRDKEGNRNASPPWWRLALDVETFNRLTRSMKTRGSSHVVLCAHQVKKICKDGSTR